VCRALGRRDLLEDERFSSAVAMRRNRVEVIALLDMVIAQRPLEEWAQRFDREGVWWAPVQEPSAVVGDPQLFANDGFVEVEDGALRTINGPLTFSGMRINPSIGVPHLGEHTIEVLEELSEGRSHERSDPEGA
jgi:crotonobetainyl-CoA:carnitine CoA-transferase CaiB-like acyl-CoA transferase